MDRAEAEARMREVQRIMERTTLYTLLPGLPAIEGGILVLVGCAVSYAVLGSLDPAAVLAQTPGWQAGLCSMWAAIAAIAIVKDVVSTARAARRMGMSPVARPGRFAAYSLTPSVLVAVVLTLKFSLDGQIAYIVPTWMMCYGTGVYAAGLFSVRLPRLLGMAFIVMGAAGLLLFTHYGVVLAALSFGALHIAFGLIVLVQSSRSRAA